MQLFEELKRRNVFRVAGAYAVGSWVLAQAAALLESAYGLPDWTDTAIITVLLIGFPVATALAWFFELTPQGIRLTRTVPAEESITRKTGRKLDIAILVGLGLVVVMLGVNAMTGSRAPAQRGPLGSSIAVLPFVDMSPQKDQEYFSDGVTEELLNSLARINGLQVAGRTSSFAFKGENRDLREIASILDVDYILEGSIRKSGDQLRITAQLIKADDGFHAWSQTFDRQLTDVFAMQDEITVAIVEELSPFLPAAAASAPKLNVTADMDAYEMFLLARQKASNVATVPALLESLELLERVVEKTPDYAPGVAWRAIARLTYLNGSPSADDGVDPFELARADIDRAKALDPNLPELYHAEGLYYFVLYQLRNAGTLQQAISSFRKALEIRPSYSLARNDMALALADSGDHPEAIRQLQLALDHDPALIDANYNVITLLSRFGRVEEAQQAIDRWSRIDATHKLLPLAKSNVMLQRGDLADGYNTITAALQASPDDALVANTARNASILLGEYRNIASFIAQAYDAADVAQLKGLELVGTVDRNALSTYVRATPALHLTPRRGLRDYSYLLMIARDPGPVRDYFDLQLSAPGLFVTGLDACLCSPIGIAWALKDTSHPSYESVMREWRTWLDANAKEFAKSSNWWISNGDYALMRGDAKSALTSYTKAVDFGHRGVALLPGHRPMLPTTPDYKGLQDRVRKLINAERNKLGWQPLK